MEARTERNMMILSDETWMMVFLHEPEKGDLIVTIGEQDGSSISSFIAKFENVADWINGQQRQLERNRR